METLMQLNNIRGGYHKKTIINGISFEIKRGDFLGLIGPNGSGKTTLLRLMTGVLKPQGGAVTLEGQDIGAMELKEFCQKVAFVSHDNMINFSFNVFEIVLMGRIPHLKRLQPEGRRDFKIAEDSLALTDASHLKEKMIDELSSGERQRVIIAKALAQEPTLLFLDEPTSHLDIGHQIQILDLLKRLNRQNNLTIVTVLHDLNLASEYCSAIALIDKGRIFKSGSPEDVLTYQNIEAVYKTIVVVEKNPLTSRPFVLSVSQEK